MSALVEAGLRRVLAEPAALDVSSDGLPPLRSYGASSSGRDDSGRSGSGRPARSRDG